MDRTKDRAWINHLLPTGDGHTELSDEDRQGLLPSYISTRGELFDAEQRNNAMGLLGRRPTTAQLLDDKYLRDLHKAMFDQVWQWAGRYRRIETNIGIEPQGIAIAVRELVADTKVWIEERSFNTDELAGRFHHRLVAIHPFPNGNGRLGRVATDLLLQALDTSPFAWGSQLALATPELRGQYIAALQRADRGDFPPLLKFARS